MRKYLILASLSIITADIWGMEYLNRESQGDSSQSITTVQKDNSLDELFEALDSTEEKDNLSKTSKKEILKDWLFDRKFPSKGSEYIRYDLNQINKKNGKTLLHYACEMGDPHLITDLLSLRANINATDNNGNPVLFSLYEANKYELMKFLIKKGADVNARNSEGSTLLHIACQKKDYKMIDVLLEAKVDVSVGDKYGNNLLHYACKENQLSIVGYLVDKIDIYGCNKYGETPIFIACKEGHKETVNLLLNHNRKFHKEQLGSTNIYGETPLFNACESGNKELVEYLFRYVDFIKPDHKNRDGYNALDVTNIFYENDNDKYKEVRSFLMNSVYINDSSDDSDDSSDDNDGY